MFQQPSYPVVQFLLRWGNHLVIAIALLPLAAALAAILGGFPAWLLAPALVAAPVLWLFVKSYIEVLAIIADTLLPK